MCRNRTSFLKALGFTAVALTLFLGVTALHRYQSNAALRFVNGLGPGFNLGNTLDVHDLHYDTNETAEFERYWGNPITTEQMIGDIKSAGFNVLRVPVSWYEHLDNDYLIDPEWLSRVQQIVDYGIQNDMYVILNSHHDSWYTPDENHLPQARELMRGLWRQIADRFAEYDERLLFESMNEPRLIGTDMEWNAGTMRSREIVNELNDIFVYTIRESKNNNNRERYLLLPTYCARTELEALEGFSLPEDKRLILSVHLYTPFDFALNLDGTSQFSPNTDSAELEQMFTNLNRLFISEGTPVIITEFGAIDKGNERQRAEWAEYVLKNAKKLGIACVWWDAGGHAEEGKPFPLYNRYTREWLFPKLTFALTGKNSVK